jgi:hypothetical protein
MVVVVLGVEGLPGLVLQQMEQLVRESDGALRGPAFVSGGPSASEKMPGVLRRRPDGSFERVIALDRTDVSPSKGGAGTDGRQDRQTPETQGGRQTPETQGGRQTPETQEDRQTPETQGEAFVRPRTRSAGRGAFGIRKQRELGEGDKGGDIDEDAAMSKQTVQAIRILHHRHM